MGLFDRFLSPEQRLMREQMRLAHSPVRNSATYNAMRGSALVPSAQAEMNALQQEALTAPSMIGQPVPAPQVPMQAPLTQRLPEVMFGTKPAVGREQELARSLVANREPIPASNSLLGMEARLARSAMGPVTTPAPAPEPAPEAQPAPVADEQTAADAVEQVVSGTRSGSDRIERPAGLLQRLQNIDPENLGLIAFGLSMMGGNGVQQSSQLGMQLYNTLKAGEIESSQRQAVTSLLAAEGIEGDEAAYFAALPPADAINQLQRRTMQMEQRAFELERAREERAANLAVQLELEAVKQANRLEIELAKAEASEALPAGVDKTFLRKERERSNDLAVTLNDLVDQYQMVTPDLLAGPKRALDGINSRIANAFGGNTSPEADRRTRFAAKNAEIAIEYAKAMSGAEVKEEERKRLEKTLPTVRNSIGEFKQISAQRMGDVINELDTAFLYLGGFEGMPEPTQRLYLAAQQIVRNEIGVRGNDPADNFTDDELDELL